MNPKIKAKWIKALLSGKYKKGKEALRPTDKTWCCLGVLCDLYSKASGTKWTKTELGWMLEDARNTLPVSVFKWAGLDSHNPPIGKESLATLNDGTQSYPPVKPHTFRQIAALIKKHL